jgi:bacterioferritin-associated ferredoxin
MILCVCRAVSDRRVREAIADGASTLEEVTESCRAGGDCGACHRLIHCLLADDSATNSPGFDAPYLPATGEGL